MTTPTTQAPVQQRQLTAAQLAQIVVLLKAQSAIRSQLTATAIAAATAPLRGFTRWWDADAVSAVITRVLRVVQPAQLRAARATDVFAAQVTSILTGRRARPVGAVDITRLRRAIPDQVAQDLVAGRRRPVRVELGDTVAGPGADINAPADRQVHDRGREQFIAPEQPYGRVADAYRYNVIARGDSPDKAARKAHVRIAQVAETDITLAVREQYNRSFDLDRVEGWRRILHPERGRGGPPCGLCVVAADRVYKKEELLPLHPACRCEVLPILDGLDPGLRLNGPDLAAIYEAAGGTAAGTDKRGLRSIRVALTEHGELGPVLVDADQHHRGPVEVARAQHPDRHVRAQAQLDALLKSLFVLEERADRGDLDDDRPLKWQRSKVEELRRELAGSS